MEIKLNNQQEEDYHKIQIYHNGHYRTIDISSLVSLTKGSINNLSLEEIEDNLEKISAYRASILVLKELVDEKLQEVRQSLETILGKLWDEATSIAIQRRSIKKETTSVPNSWFGSITKEEIKGIILSDSNINKEYLYYSQELRKYQKSYRLLAGILEILEDRGTHLQSILKSRLSRKFTS